MEVVINYWAVLAAAAAAIVLGTLWYGPLFGKQWMRIVGISMGEMTPAVKRSMARSYGILVVSVLVMAFVLAHLVSVAFDVADIEGVFAAVTVAIWLWLGLIVPVTLGPVLWENRPWKYWFITGGYYLVSLVLMSVILAVWK